MNPAAPILTWYPAGAGVLLASAHEKSALASVTLATAAPVGAKQDGGVVNVPAEDHAY